MSRLCVCRFGTGALFAILLAALGLPREAGAQEPTGRLSGRVVTQDAGRALEGAHVRLEGTSRGTATDADGRFALSDVPVGDQTLVVSYVGYDAARRSVAVRTEENTTVTIALSLSSSRLDAVEVVGTQKAFQHRYELTATQTAMEPETLEDFNSANNYDALRLVPGVHYIRGSGGRYSGPSRIRGGSSWTIPQVIEGFPSLRASGIGAEDGGLKAGMGTIIPSVALAGLEVKKGNSGVLHSGGADGGVIVNTLERGRTGSPSGELLVDVNSISERLYMGDVGGGTERFDYYAAAKVLNGDYEGLTDTFERTRTSDDFMSGLVRLGYDVSDAMRLEVTGLRGNDEIRYRKPQEDDASTEVDESRTDQRFETTNTTTFAGLTWEHDVNETVSYEAGYSYYRDWAHRFSVTEDRAHRDRPQYSHTTFANVHVQQSLSETVDYTARLGGEVVRHHQEENAQGSDKAHDFTDRSVVLANSVSVWDRLVVNGGLRYLYATDEFKTQSLALYDLGASYRLPGVETRVHASYSTGYSRNKGFTFFFGPIEEAGGVALSESRAAEVGIEQPFSLTGADEGKISVTGYRRQNDRVPTFSGWGAGTVYYETQEAQGLEVLLRERVNSTVSVTGSFAYTDTEVLETTHPDGVDVGNTSLPVPQYTGGLGLQVRPASGVQLSVIGTYDDGMRERSVDPETGEVTTTTHTSYTRINVSGRYRVTDRLSLKLRVENVLDQTDLGYSSETFGPDGFSQSESVAERPGRLVSMSVRFRY